MISIALAACACWPVYANTQRVGVGRLGVVLVLEDPDLLPTQPVGVRVVDVAVARGLQDGHGGRDVRQRGVAVARGPARGRLRAVAVHETVEGALPGLLAGRDLGAHEVEVRSAEQDPGVDEATGGRGRSHGGGGGRGGGEEAPSWGSWWWWCRRPVAWVSPPFRWAGLPTRRRRAGSRPGAQQRGRGRSTRASGPSGGSQKLPSSLGHGRWFDRGDLCVSEPLVDDLSTDSVNFVGGRDPARIELEGPSFWDLLPTDRDGSARNVVRWIDTGGGHCA